MKRAGALVLLQLFLLSGCALIPLSATEQSYVDDCKVVQANFKEYIKLQDEFYDAEYNDPEFAWASWSGGYVVTNAGQSSRDTAFSSIQAKFPWILSITQSYFENMSRKEFLKQESDDWSDDLEWTVHQDFFRGMAKGSNFDITIELLKKIKDSSYILELDKVLAALAPSDRLKNCDDALGLKDEESFDSLSNDYGLYGNTGIHLSSVSEISIALWGCKKFGVGYVDYGSGSRKCAGEDYVYDPSKYPTTNEPTAEELAILAERESTAQSEAENPSNGAATSNVTPGQVCGSLGAVVQTENYGELVCKVLWLNRIKALVWLRR